MIKSVYAKHVVLTSATSFVIEFACGSPSVRSGNGWAVPDFLAALLRIDYLIEQVIVVCVAKIAFAIVHTINRRQNTLTFVTDRSCC